MWRSLFHCDNAYLLPAVEVVGRVCRTHKTSQTAFRGFGGPQAMVVIEDILSHAARAPCPDRPTSSASATSIATGEYDPLRPDGRRCLAHAADLVRAEDVQHVRRRGDRRRHVQCDRTRTRSADSPSHRSSSAFRSPQRSSIRPAHWSWFTATASVQVNHGGTEMGQGLFTKIQQIAADGLGVWPCARARDDDADRQGAEHVGDGRIGRHGPEWRGGRRRLRADSRRGWHRSRQRSFDERSCRPSASPMARAQRRRGDRSPFAPRVRSRLLAARPALLRRGSTARRAFTSIARPDADDRSSTLPSARPYRRSKSTDSPVSIGCCAPTSCRTSAIPSRRSSIAARSKAGFIQGVGWLTIEELRWDDEGRVATGSASTYKLPSWSEVPDVFNVDFLPQRGRSPTSSPAARRSVSRR